jgi:tetratricopeptide (TPR) repeat protein
MGQVFDIDETINHYTKEIKTDPNNPEYYFLRGKTYIEKGEYQNSVPDFSQSFTLYQNLDKEYEDNANRYMDADCFDDGIQEFIQSGKFAQKTAEALYYRGLAYNKIADYSNAINDFTSSLKNWPPLHIALFCLCERAMSYFNKSDLQNAFSDLKAVLRIVPDHTLAIENMNFIQENVQKVEDKK